MNLNLNSREKNYDPKGEKEAEFSLFFLIGPARERKKERKKDRKKERRKERKKEMGSVRVHRSAFQAP